MRLSFLFLAATLLVAPSIAHSDEKTTDWAEYKFVPVDPEHRCVMKDNNLYCPRNRILVQVAARRVMDPLTILELQRLQKANSPAVSQLDSSQTK